MNRKLLALLLVSFTLLSPAAAQYQTGTDSDGEMHFPSYQYPYGSGSTQIEPYCDRSETGTCPSTNRIEVKICGSQWLQPSIAGSGDPDRLVYSTNLAPSSIVQSCDIGTTTEYIQLRNTNTGEEWSGGELMFYPQTSGNYLHVGFNYDKDSLYQFRLKDTDSTPQGNLKNGASQGDVLVTHHSPEWLDNEDTRSRAFESETGVILGPFGSNNLGEIVQSCDSSYKTCKIASDLNFGTGDYSTQKCNGQCGLGYDDNGIIEYEPDMEIIAGEQFSGNSFPSGGVSNKKFYICDEALAGTDGQRVYSPGNNYETDYFECNFGNWENIEPQNNCADPAIGSYEITDTPGPSYEVTSAFWNSQSGGEFVNTETGCAYESAQPDSQDEYVDLGVSSAPFDGRSDPVTFGCENGTTNTLQDYPDLNDYDGIAHDYMTDARSDAQDYCQDRADRDFERAGDPLPMVQYYIPIDALPRGGDGAPFVSTSGNYLGIQNWKINDLYNAMQRYDGGPLSYACEDCTEESTWLDKNMTSTNAYGNDNPDGYDDAWVVDNVGGETNPNTAESNSFTVNDEGVPQEPEVFRGGFGGNCEGSLIWQYTEELGWLCTDSVDFTQEVFSPTFDYSTAEGDMVDVGFHIMPQLFNTSDSPPSLGENALPNSFAQQTNYALPENQTIQRINTVCWWGGSDRYSDLDPDNAGKSWFTAVYRDVPTDIQNPLPVYGQLNKTVRDQYGGGPSCRWMIAADPAVKFDDQGLEYDPYVLSGSVDSVTSNINNRAQERGYTSSNIDIAEEYKKTMKTERFADVSQEWESEAGYTRYDSSPGLPELNCIPNNSYFTDGVNIPGCTEGDLTFLPTDPIRPGPTHTW